MSEVLLERTGNIVLAKPISGINAEGLHDLLRGHFKFNLRIRNTTREARASGQKFRSEPRYLCGVRQGGVVFPAGLLSRSAKLFSQCHIKYLLNDMRSILLPDPRVDLLSSSDLINREDQRKALATVFSSDMGVISSPTAWGKTFIIEQLVLAYPASNIIICTYRKDVVNSIYDRLRPHVKSGQLGRVGGGHFSPKRVTVATVGSLDRAEPAKCRLFLYDEVHEAAAEKRADKVTHVRNSRMFGFSASPDGRSDGSDLVVEALFGPVIYTLSYQEAEAAGRVATIVVNVYRVPGVTIPYDDDVSQYRYGIWRNDIRNQLIARSAAEHALNGKQVLIIVDKVEHALHVKAKYLPDWPLVHGPVHAEQVRTFKRLGLLPKGSSWLCAVDKRDIYRQRFEDGKMRFAISTGVWSQGIDFRHLDVLVRADGQSSAIKNTQIPGRLSRGHTGLLVDFDDVFDARFRRRSETRLRAYRGHGWDVNYV